MKKIPGKKLKFKVCKSFIKIKDMTLSYQDSSILWDRHFILQGTLLPYFPL